LEIAALPVTDLVFEQKTSHNMHPAFWNGLLILQKD